MAEGIRKKGATYSYRINLKNPETGKWKTIEKGGFQTMAEARAAMALRKAELTEKPETVVLKDKRITLEKVYREFMEKFAQYDREKSTLKRYDSLFRNHLQPKWGSFHIGNIKASDLSEYLFAMSATHAYSYIMGLHKFMKVIWIYAEEQGYLKVNIIYRVKTPKAGSEEGQIKIYTEAQLDKLEERFASTNLITAFKLGRGLGVRLGECFGFLWSDVDWEKHTISVNKQLVFEDGMWCLRNTKTKAAIRGIDLQEEIYTYLKELKQKQEKNKKELGVAYRQTRVAVDVGRNKPKEILENPDFINLKDSGEYLTPDSEKVLARIAKKELNIHFKFHNLRHTHASWLAEHNIPAIVTKKRLGHSKEETTLKYYQHITEGMREDLLSELNGGKEAASVPKKKKEPLVSMPKTRSRKAK